MVNKKLTTLHYNNLMQCFEIVMALLIAIKLLALHHMLMQLESII
ncbi:MULTISPECIES: hypothetical protein [Helicobacter]|nr:MULTISPECIES: hypothetical protein [Helicobacter]